MSNLLWQLAVKEEIDDMDLVDLEELRAGYAAASAGALMQVGASIPCPWGYGCYGPWYGYGTPWPYGAVSLYPWRRRIYPRRRWVW